jgi:hypothetical protein
MKQITLSVNNAKYPFFMELVKSFDFVQIEKAEGDNKKEIEENLTKAFKDLKRYKQGKLKTTSAKDFLNEL